MNDRSHQKAQIALPWLLTRLLRVIWPFLLTIAGCVGLGLFSMELMSAGRAYVSGESLWSKGQKNAVLHLTEFASSCEPAEFRNYVAALSVTKGDRAARLALSKPKPDIPAAREGFLLGQNHPDDVDSMIMLFLRFGEVSFFKQAITIWAKADELVDELEAAATELKKVVMTNCSDEAAKLRAMQQVLAINERLTPLQREFSDTVGQANRLVHLLTGGVLMLITIVLASMGVMLSLRVQGRYAKAELALKQEMRSREAAMKALLHLLESGVASRQGPQTAKWSAENALEGPDTLEQVSRLVARVVDQLKRHGEHLDAIFALSPDGFVSLDEFGRINHVNAAFTRLTGLSESAALGLNEAELELRLNLLMPSGARMPHLSELRAQSTLKSHKRKLPRIELERPTQRVIELQWRQGAPGAISQVLYLRDVTYETEVDRLKSEFLSTAAHELRTPMASIIGFSELLMMRDYPGPRRTELLQTVHRQAERMAAIVDELLDLARIEARRGKDFLIERVDLCTLIEEAVHDFSVPSGRQAPMWQRAASAQWVDIDRGKVLQSFGNILGNAYKYSPEGGAVEVRLVRGELEQVSTARSAVGIQIVDHGIGLTPQQLARIGERFYRADTSGRIPGTGLGVSIVQEILHLLGGDLEFKSEYGQGSTVTLWLPLAQESGSP